MGNNHSVSNTWWLAIDESGNESVHHIEPHYNRLQKRWRSQNYIYVSNGLINIVIDQFDINKLKDEKVLAGAFEIVSVGQKAIIKEILKIFK